MKLEKTRKKKLGVQFVGCGNSTSEHLGNSSAVLITDTDKLLVIDVGFTTPRAIKNSLGDSLMLST